MLLSINVDGWPFLVDFDGTIDIERLPSNEVALRCVSKESRLSVVSDEAELERQRSVIRDVEERMFLWQQDLHNLVNKDIERMIREDEQSRRST